MCDGHSSKMAHKIWCETSRTALQIDTRFVHLIGDTWHDTIQGPRTKPEMISPDNFSFFLTNLFECLKNFLSLRKMAEQQLESPRDKRRVVVHDQVEQDSKEHPTSLSVKVKFGRLRTENNPRIFWINTGLRYKYWLPEIQILLKADKLFSQCLQRNFHNQYFEPLFHPLAVGVTQKIIKLFAFKNLSSQDCKYIFYFSNSVPGFSIYGGILGVK